MGTKRARGGVRGTAEGLLDGKGNAGHLWELWGARSSGSNVGIIQHWGWKQGGRKGESGKEQSWLRSSTLLHGAGFCSHVPGEPWTHREGSSVCTFQREKSSLPGVGSCCFYDIRIKEKVRKSSQNGDGWGSGGHPQPGISTWARMHWGHWCPAVPSQSMAHGVCCEWPWQEGER